jgi:hypothetical protein
MPSGLNPEVHNMQSISFMVLYIITEWSSVSSTIPCYVADEFCLQLGIRFPQYKEDNITWYIQKNIQ